MPSLKLSFFAGLVVGAGFGLMLFAFVLYMWSRGHRLKQQRAKSQFAAALAVVLGSAGLAWMLSTVGPIIRSRLDSAFALLAMMLFIAACILALAILTASGLDKRGRNVLYRNAWFIFGLGIVATAWMFYLRSVPGSRDDAMVLEVMPVHQEWRVIFGGRSKLTNYFAAQGETPSRYAVTFIQTSDSANNENDQQITAPLKGTVINAEELKIKGSTSLAIKSEKEQVLVIRNIAHSLEVGAEVKTGDTIGTANTYRWSHNRAGISMHAEKDGKPVPILIGPKRRFPIRGDIIQGQ